jgi:hypothetical protein
MNLALPGAGTPTLRHINQLWHIHDASLAVPFDLHPHGEHRANKWSTLFQDRLGRVVRITSPQERQQVFDRMRDVVNYRNQGKASRVAFLTTVDLATVYRQLMRKRNRRKATGGKEMVVSAGVERPRPLDKIFFEEMSEILRLLDNYQPDHHHPSDARSNNNHNRLH